MTYTLVYEPKLGKALSDLDCPSPTAATIFLRQVAYWLTTNSGYYTEDGKKWIYNSYKDWVKDQLPSLSEFQFGRMFRALKGFGFVVGSCFAHLKDELVEEPPVAWHEDNRTTWLTLDFELIYQKTGWLAPGFKLPEEPLETAPGANVHICSLENADLNPPTCNFETCTIYKENPISTKDWQSSKKKEEQTAKSEEKIPATEPVDNKIPEKERPIKTKQAVKGKSSRDSYVREKRIWEIAIDEPFPVFLSWRANKHYKPQGERWETDCYAHAYAEFYNNPTKTTNVLFPQFMREVRTITERINQGQINNVEAANVLPSWFIEDLPEASPENIKQLMDNLQAVMDRGVRVLLPHNSPSPSDITVPLEQVQERSKITPLPVAEEPPLQIEEEIVAEEEDRAQKEGEKFIETFERKKKAWEMLPKQRSKIREWVERTPRVIITENGLQLLEEPLESGSVVNSNENVSDTLKTQTSTTENYFDDDPWADTPVPSVDKNNPPTKSENYYERYRT